MINGIGCEPCKNKKMGFFFCSSPFFDFTKMSTLSLLKLNCKCLSPKSTVVGICPNKLVVIKNNESNVIFFISIFSIMSCNVQVFMKKGGFGTR